MAAKNVTVIPATVNPLTRMPAASMRKRRAAGYARVSTSSDEQFTSYEAQVDYYTRFIQHHAVWEFVRVYTDEGISGLGTKQRTGFNEMIADAMAGRIDIIVTKSVSRFARNTVDSLVTIRKLKEKGVEVFFEKENIYSLDGKGELLLTIMSSLAQEESRSISANVTWGQRKRFSDGKVSLPYKKFLGYDRGEKKGDPPVVNAEQAEVVRRIYSLFMEGKTQYQIAGILTTKGVPMPAGKSRWGVSTVSSILANEKYRGSARLQKTFTVDYLTKRVKKNDGEVPQYYVEQSHEAIIDPAEWDAVQEEILRRKAIGRAYSGVSVLGAKIVCGDCGGWYGRKVWHSTDRYKTVVWQCNCKFDSEKPRCATPHVTEEDVKRRFLEVYNRILADREVYLETSLAAKELLADTADLDAEIAELPNEMSVVTALTKKCISENAGAAQDQAAYTERYNSYVDRYEKAKARYDDLIARKERRMAKGRAIDRFIASVEGRAEPLTVFDNRLWLTVIDRVTVRRDGVLVFRFYDGREVEG